MKIFSILNSDGIWNQLVRANKIRLKTKKIVIYHTKRTYKKLTGIIDRRPLGAFFSLLGFLGILIIAGNLLQRPPTPQSPKPEIKKVETYSIGTAPRITVQGQVEKSGSIQVTALSGGIVQKIYVHEGDKTKKGQWLILLASNYQGGNALAVAREIAEKQNQNIEESYPLSKDLIGKQRDLANQTETNFEKLRDISSQSVNDTQNLINLNNTIISSLSDNISALSSAGPTSTSASLILASQQMESQFQSANLQLNTSLRNAQYQSDSNNPPTVLSNEQKDITLKQLDIQDKALDLNREISKLQVQLARINEGTMYPAAPFAATVEHIYVRTGQAVSPGMPLISLSSTGNQNLKVNVYTSKEIAEKISRTDPSLLTVGNKTESLFPAFVSTEAVSGNLYNIMYSVPEEDVSYLTDKGYISVQIPIGYADTGTTIPYIPLDAIYQSQDESYVFLINKGKAVARKITLGNVFGRYVEIKSGLTGGDSIILDRNVVEDDPVAAL